MTLYNKEGERILTLVVYTHRFLCLDGTYVEIPQYRVINVDTSKVKDAPSKR